MSTRLERLIHIDRKVRQQARFDAQSLAGELEVSPRTIQLDLEILRDRFRAPLIYDRELGRYRYTEPDFMLPTIDLNDREIMALLLGQQVLRHLAGNALGASYHTAIAKIQDTWAERDPAVAHDGIWFGGEVGPTLPNKLFRELLDAVRAHRKVCLTYRAASTTEITERTVDPYGLYLHSDTWYLIAFCGLRQDYRYFHLARIEDWDVLDQGFEVQADFDMTQYLRRAFQLEQGHESFEVTVRFRQPSARYVQERTWHPDQKLSELADGAIELRFPAASEREVRQWVLGYGADAEIVAPERLRASVKEELQRTLSRY